MKKEKRIFAQGFCFFKLFYFFLFGCLFGTYFEEILFFVQNHEWTCRAGVIYGPFSPLYGFGVLIFVLFLFSKNKERGVFSPFSCVL